jgi:class 3 adenylate cyclase
VTESRKTVTIVFADVTGSTALGEQTDPEAMRRIMERYFEEMRSALEKHGDRPRERKVFSRRWPHRSLWIVARREELDEAAALSHESEGAGMEDDIATQSAWRVARALVLARRGAIDEAVALARQDVEVAAASEYAQFTAEARIGFADVLRLAGRADEAAGELEEAVWIYEGKEFELSADAVRAKLAELQSSGSPSQ